ncbi:MAG: lamin tail domain-containing protein [Candidatus Omnitrophica bacterium]|nr:lamin tail domain-containing protein [Candidatus Omnitrophota bacterium]
MNAIEQVGAVLGTKDFNLVKDSITVYSKDPEIDVSRKRRVYLNSLWPQKALESFLIKGVKDAFQKAANLKDAIDTDLSQTQLIKFSLSNLGPSALVEGGGWSRVGNYYQALRGTAEGKFSWSGLAVDDGEYYCFFNAPDNEDTVGEVIVDDSDTGALILSGEGPGKKVKVSGGAFTVRIRPSKDTDCRFLNIELSDMIPRNGLQRKVVSGTEALVINELMVKLAAEFTSGTISITPGQDYKHVFSGVRVGSFHLQIKAGTAGATVGDVTVNGQTASNMHDGDYFPSVVHVDCDDPKNNTGPLTLEIRNNSVSNTSFGGIKVLQEPDAEYVEILNLSGDTIDLSNFVLVVYNSSGDLVPGWPATIPKGAKIDPYQELVLAVDSNDGSPAPVNLRSNGISFQSVWGTTATGLIFEEQGIIDKRFDALPDAGGMVMLCNAQGERIDAVKYAAQSPGFTSLERGDPSAAGDSDGDGLFDLWYIGSQKELHATPGSVNENAGTYTIDKTTGEAIKHYPTEVKVFNHPLSNLTDVLQLSSGQAWKKFTISDLAQMVDHFAYEALNFDLVGHYKEGDFLERSGAFESRHQGESGTWEFTDIARGDYLLTILGDESTQFSGNEKVQVSLKTGSQQDFTPAATIFFTTQGIIFYGKIEFLKNPSQLTLKIVNNTETRIAIKSIQLEPIYVTPGRINVNTARAEVLRGILGSDSLVQTVIKNRPIGAKDSRKLGVGDLFLLDSSFLAFHNYLTVKSDVYEIRCRGEYHPIDKILATLNIRSVVERGE